MQGWVKLHKRLLENEMLQNDHSAMILFIVLLLLAKSTTGVVTAGRFQLADYSGLNPNTVYKALQRLEKAKMVTLDSNTRFTTIVICNWSKYQGAGNTSSNTPSNNTATTQQQPSNTIKEIDKDKELENTSNKLEVLTPEQAQMEKDVDYIWQYWEDTTGLPITRSKPSNKVACRTLIKKHGIKGLETLIRVVAAASTEKYAPSVANFIQLRDKEGNLLIWARKQGQQTKGRTVKI